EVLGRRQLVAGEPQPVVDVISTAVKGFAPAAAGPNEVARTEVEYLRRVDVRDPAVLQRLDPALLGRVIATKQRDADQKDYHCANSSHDGSYGFDRNWMGSKRILLNAQAV